MNVKEMPLPSNKSCKVNKLLEFFQFMLKPFFKENKLTACSVTCFTEGLPSDSLACT